MTSLHHKMIVKKAFARRVTAPLIMPFRIATGQHDSLLNIFFVVELASGIKGYGEAAVASHITGETIEGTLANLTRAGEALCGVDISDPFAVCRAVHPGFVGNHAALAAFEMAVLDAFTRTMKMPLWALFGDKPSCFSTDITVVIGTLEEAGAIARDFYKRGFRTFKIKIGRDADLDLRRVLAVKTVAPRSTFVLDANQGFNARTMLKFLKVLRAKGVCPALLEQPVPKADWEGLRDLTRCAGVLVCADESVGCYAEAVRAIRTKTISAINIKFMKSGILESVDIARLAKAKGIKLMIGAMMESSLAITASAHFAAGIGGIDFIDLDTTFFIKGPLARSSYLNAKGCFDLSAAGAGIGVIPRVR